MFTIDQYVGIHKDSPDWDTIRQDNAARLLTACANLQNIMEADGVKFPINPKTGSEISGETYGGFRPQSCPIGAAHSSHKEGLAVDRFDPNGEIDGWLMRHQDVLEMTGIYIEAPDSTPGWSHWTIRAPMSGKHVFIP